MLRAQLHALAKLYDFAVLCYWAAVFYRWRMRMSLRDKIKSTPDSSSEVIEIPEWDVKLEVRSMTARVRARMLRDCVDPDDGTMDFEKLYPALLVACCYDPDSAEAVFGEADIEWINDKASGPVERLAQAGMRLSGLSREAVDAGKGDSSPSPTSDTSSS